VAISAKCSPVGGAIGSGSAPVVFTAAPAGPSVNSNLEVTWDFDNDGDWDSAVEDITGYVMSAESFTGRDMPSSLAGKSGPGKLRLALNNTDDRFSPMNTASPLNTAPFSLKTGRRVRVRTTDGVLGASLISYVGAGALAAGSNASVFPALPAGLVPGDTMLIVASIRNSGTGTVNTPGGWANLFTSGNVTVLGRVYQTDDPTPTVSFAGGVANATTLAQCIAFRGCRQNLVALVGQSAAQLNGSAQNINVPGLTVTDANQAVVVVAWKQDDWTSITDLSGQGLTEISDSFSLLGDDAAHAIDYKIETGAANFTATTMTVTGGGAAISRALVFTLRPAVDLVDPVLLAVDRFDRADSAQLGTDEWGTPWVVRAATGFAIKNGCAAANDDRVALAPGADVISTLDVGTVDHYVQASIPHVTQDGRVGLVVRWVDVNNHTRAYYKTEVRGLLVEDVKAGVVTQLGSTWFIESWEAMTLGLGVANQTVTLYLGGFPLQTYQIGRPLTGTSIGLYGWWETWSDLPPTLDDLYVWDRVASDLDGVLWTGTVKGRVTQAAAGALKVATVDCEGPLSAAAQTTVPAPRVCRTVGEHIGTGGPNHSVPAGALVGDIMARAGTLHPPHPLAGSQISSLGPVAVADGKALALARMVEVNERGFLKETPQGQTAFEDRLYRAGDQSKAWFTDTPGRGQYGYRSCVPFDSATQIVNQATARVAATAPTVVSSTYTFDQDSALTVSVVLPSLEVGQLVLVFIACSADAANVEFGCAPPWKAERSLRQAEGNGIRIFSLIATGFEGGTTAYFYKGTSAGSFTAHTYVITDWYGTEDGIKVGRVSPGMDAYPISPGWSRAPALYIMHQSIIGATSVSPVTATPSVPPAGYAFTTLDSSGIITGTLALSTAMTSVHKTDVTDTENPRPWLNLYKDYLLLESVVVAVRGYDGPLGKPTIDNPKATGGAGLFVTSSNLESQYEHNLIRSNPEVPVLMYDEADAGDWTDGVVAEFAEDRPILAIEFVASKSAALRALAMRLRLSDRITVTATGRSGLGIEADFHVEGIGHKFTQGTKLWVCRLECSPV
jgi:hypothetical protein